MAHDKMSFVKKNGKQIYPVLETFFDCEINETTYDFILNLVRDDCVRSVDYEGNMYALIKQQDKSEIILVNEVAEANRSISQTRFAVAKSDFIDFIKCKFEGEK